MRSKLTAWTASAVACIGAAVIVHAGTAGADDMPIDAAKLVITRSATGKHKLVFVSKDPAALFAALGSPDDPVAGVPGGATVTLVSPVENIQSIAVSAGAGDPGWSARQSTSGGSYTYRNSLAPNGPSVVRSMLFKRGRLIKLVARDTVLPMASAHGTLGIRIETGTLRNCAVFDAASIVTDTPGRFVAVRGTSLSLDDCSDESLGEPPFCGDGVRTGTEDCDGADDAACPGLCNSGCRCSVCGDAEIGPGEECDPPAFQGGDPSCRHDCILAVCGDGRRELTEECDPPASAGGASTCNDDCTYSRCGDGELGAGEQCESDAECAGGEACSPCCTCMDPACPDTLRMTLHAQTGVLSTDTEYDLGFTGIAHDQDFLDQSPLELRLCSAAGAAPACGESIVRGLSPATRNCRCANDNHTTCDRPLYIDSQNCGGAACHCHMYPPQPLSFGNTPSCHVWRIVGDVSGTWNVDTGQGALSIPVRDVVYSGEWSTIEPCPTCVGDVVANDGVRDGVCSHGDDDGEACDANATDATFPAPGGGAYSYDCMPSPGKNKSGAGLEINVEISTGASVLHAAVPCGYQGELLCPCGVCTSPINHPCSSDADCASGGVCEDDTFFEPMPNDCGGAGCIDTGGGEGQCDGSPVEKGCDGILRANGKHIFSCNSNADCAPENIGVDAGNCTMSQVRACFLDPITVSGTASPTDPVLGGVFCVPLTAGAGFNTVHGLPGPLRAKIAASVTLPCAGNPTFNYPNCP